MHGMHRTDLQNFNNEQKLNKISCIEKEFFGQTANKTVLRSKYYLILHLLVHHENLCWVIGITAEFLINPVSATLRNETLWLPVPVTCIEIAPFAFIIINAMTMQRQDFRPKAFALNSKWIKWREIRKWKLVERSWYKFIQVQQWTISNCCRTCFAGWCSQSLCSW